tara:strand:+ start:25 stop:591 length:567 start_codon:yes stop_codon:yes gene_type:complete
VKNFLFILFLFSFLTSFSQNSFYLGTGFIGTTAEVFSGDNSYKKYNVPDFGLYCGNLIKVSDKFNIGPEFFYLNNRTVLGEEGEERFELHQNLGFKLRSGLYFKKHSFFLTGGVSGVYLFDKDELLGYQIDRFDESYFYGLEYSCNFFDQFHINLGFLSTSFESISHYTDYTLRKFSTFHVSIHYYLY